MVTTRDKFDLSYGRVVLLGWVAIVILLVIVKFQIIRTRYFVANAAFVLVFREIFTVVGITIPR